MTGVSFSFQTAMPRCPHIYTAWTLFGMSPFPKSEVQRLGSGALPRSESAPWNRLLGDATADVRRDSFAILQVTPPRRPVVLLPALGDAIIVLIWHIKMNQVYAALSSFGAKQQDKRRVGIGTPEFR
jgi:hypothetical protein